MTADPKPIRRIRDNQALRDFPRDRECISCGHARGVEAHHILRRSQGGDDVAANLVPLCRDCHGAVHGTPYTAWGVRIDAAHVRKALHGFLGSEQGMAARWYLTGKLGVEASLAFVDRLEA